ncbi:unnamed protein product [Moneuplotes crassus]|uniref:Uncharacterized protein n=1 Tax=Euplotes crassus TaxID=5936 RepID=A0AAD2D209_EUPCR|nr:unnamed protein product [Moneuplotes crassus]
MDTSAANFSMNEEEGSFFRSRKMSASEILKVQIYQYENAHKEILHLKRNLKEKRISLENEMQSYVEANREILQETDKTQSEILKTLNDINVCRRNLAYKIEELKIFHEALQLHEETKHKTNIDMQNMKVDYSYEEKYFRELKSNISITLQNIKQSSLDEDIPSLKKADKTLTNCYLSMEQLSCDLSKNLKLSKKPTTSKSICDINKEMEREESGLSLCIRAEKACIWKVLISFLVGLLLFMIIQFVKNY